MFLNFALIFFGALLVVAGMTTVILSSDVGPGIWKKGTEFLWTVATEKMKLSGILPFFIFFIGGYLVAIGGGLLILGGAGLH